MRKLRLDDNHITTDPKVILREQENFYKNLYEQKLTDSNKEESLFFLNSPHLKKLSEDEKESCEGLLTTEECEKIVRALENNKSPVNDGLTSEFYKAFWHLFDKLIVDSFNASFQEGMMSSSQR